MIICGPTGGGKSAAAMRIAAEFDGSIVGADSRQIYRRLDIGTAKPSLADREKIPHFMIDIADIREDFTAMRYAREAIDKIEQILDAGRIPIIVGGTGLYIEALTRGIFVGPGKDQEIRARLKKTIKSEGLAALYERLGRIDPGAAAAISPHDETRIIRSLEIAEQSGIPASSLRKTSTHVRADIDFSWIGLQMPRPALYERINARVDKMMEKGLVEEIRGLLEDGLGPYIKSKKIVGYSEIISALEGDGDLDRAVEEIKRHSRNYAKRQMTWFRNRSAPIWLDPESPGFYRKVFSLLDEYLKRT